MQSVLKHGCFQTVHIQLLYGIGISLWLSAQLMVLNFCLTLASLAASQQFCFCASRFLCAAASPFFGLNRGAAC